MPEPPVPSPSGAPDADRESFVSASESEKTRYGRFNLAIIGPTGVGKSSLVNAVFGRELAEVGIGLPVTAGVDYYHEGALGIWDVEGFEIGSSASHAEMLREHLRTIARRPANEQISVVWYCIAANGARIAPGEIEMIRELYGAGLPVILVLTKVAWSKHPVTGRYRAPADVEQFRGVLERLRDSGELPVQRIILTAARARNGKDAGHGVHDLVVETLALAPESEKDAFRVAQRLNLPWKRELARKAIAAASTAATAAAAVPIPVADAATLAPIQLTMMGRISAVYELELKTMLSASALAQFGTQLAGQALARSFIKLIPGAGAAVNASVALALTAAIGEAWMRLCEQIHSGRIDVSRIDEAWRDQAPSVALVLRKLVEQRASKR